MPRSEQQHLGSEVAQIKRAIKDLQSGRLQNASMHGTRLYIYDDDGDIREVIGNQGDGSYGSRVIKSPPQPTPTAPILTTGDLGSVMAEWDGGIVQGRVPVVHGHLKVLALFLGEDGQWDPDEARLVSSIRDRDGGATTLALGTTGRWGVAFQMVGADRVTMGAVSAPSEITVTALVDTEEIEAELEAARQERQEYRDAFDERTDEYDRLMAEQEDALAETDAWGHTAVYRADQAAAEAIAARDTAERAEDNAAIARETADGSLELQAITDPEGVGSADGQRWVKYDHMGRDRKIQGVWVWNADEEAWDAISHDVTYLPMADITSATIGDARAQRVFAEVGEVERLRVGANSGNLITDPGFEDFSLWLDGGNKTVTTGNNGQFQRALRCTADLNTVRWVVQPGEQLYADFDLGVPSGTTMGRVSWRFETLDGDYHSFGPFATDVGYSGWRRRRAEATVPDAGGPLLAHLTFRMADGSNFLIANPAAGRITPGELIVEGLLRADRGVIRELITETAVGQTALFELVRAGLIEADEALIGSVLLKEGAVTADKLYVTEEMVARFAQILHLVADQVEMNTFVAQSGMVGVLEAIGIVLSNQAGGRRFEVSGDGFRLTDTEDDHVIAQLGTQSDDLISLHDSETGDPVITMTQDGGVASQALTVGSDPSFGGKRLAGDLYESPRWHSSSSVFGMTGGHVVAHHRRSFGGENSGNAGNGQSIAHLEAYVEPGRLYRVQCHDFEMNDRRPYFIEAFYTTSDDPDVRPEGPNRHSVSWGPSPARVPQPGQGHGAKLTFDRVVSFNTARRIRINFVVGVNGSDGILNFGNLQRHAAHFTVTDVGPNLGSSGADLFQAAGNSTASVPEPQSLLREIYPVARTATYTLSSSGVATRQYTNGEMRFGRWPDGNTYLTVVEFSPWDQAGVPQAVDLPFRVSRWVSASGEITQVGIPSFSGTPATFTYGDQVEALPAARNVSTIGVSWVQLDHDQQMEIADRQSAAVVLGGSGWTSSPYPASGVATSRDVAAALSTDVSGQTTGEGDE